MPLCSRATTRAARARRQTGGRVSLFCTRTTSGALPRRCAQGGRVRASQGGELWHGRGVPHDVYGNLWDLLELKAVASGGVQHIDLTVIDLALDDFCDRILPSSVPPRRGHPGPVGRCAARIGLQPALSPTRTTATRRGCHLALAAPSRARRRRAPQPLVPGFDPGCARGYPYAPGYYAVFFADPDGIKLGTRTLRDGPNEPQDPRCTRGLAGARAPPVRDEPGAARLHLAHRTGGWNHARRRAVPQVSDVWGHPGLIERSPARWTSSSTVSRSSGAAYPVNDAAPYKASGFRFRRRSATRRSPTRAAT